MTSDHEYFLGDDALIFPKRGKNELILPESGLILVNPKEAAYGHSLIVDQGGGKRSFPHSNLSVHSSNHFFIAGPAVGSPIAAMVVEKLIALGARKIFVLSWCGAISPGLKIGDIVIGGQPFSGEGTSRYYPTKKPAMPSIELSTRLFSCVSEMGMNPIIGRIWTTDAPYRESKQYLQKIRRDEEIVGVDMEYSALCSVSAFRKIELAALFLVSDELWGEKWKPGFKDTAFQALNKQLVRALVSEGMYAGD